MQSELIRQVRVVSGSGRYTDPWHPFAETSTAIAAVVTDLGHRCEVVESEPAALAELDGVDLLVINAGGNPRVELEPDPDWRRAFGSAEQWVAAGHPVLGVHTASNAFPDWPAWPTILGGRWVRGQSMHPPRSTATFTAVPDAAGHPALGGLTEVTAYDERYSYLQVLAGSVPLLQHRHDDDDHVAVWARPGEATAVYDGLGHGPESYESDSRRALLAAELAWLFDPTDPR